MSEELLKVLLAGREKVAQVMEYRLAEAEVCKRDLVDLDIHIERQRDLARRRAAAEPATQEIPAVPAEPPAPEWPPRPGADDGTTVLPVYAPPNGLTPGPAQEVEP